MLTRRQRPEGFAARCDGRRPGRADLAQGTQVTIAGDVPARPILTSFGISSLWARVDGQRAGAEPVRSSRKVSFCIVDIELHAWNEPHTGPRRFSFPACVTPTESDPGNDYLVQGPSR
jgi:hypothetical protein